MVLVGKILKTINDTLARITAKQIAIVDELHMIRQVVEDHLGEYETPYVNVLENAGINLKDRNPVFFGND